MFHQKKPETAGERIFRVNYWSIGAPATGTHRSWDEIGYYVLGVWVHCRASTNTMLSVYIGYMCQRIYSWRRIK